MFTPEFKFINSLLTKAGDDAFVKGKYLIAADMSVEGTHFRLDWSSPSQAIEKCLLSNFSDINAMGGVPTAILFSVCINKKWSKKTRDEIAKAMVKICKKHKVKILGGDTTGGALGVFSIAVFGELKGKALLRSAAKPGDDIWVSGFPGKSSMGLELLKRGGKFSKQEQELVNLHKVPKPPLGLGSKLAKIKGIGACIDTSDTLAESLFHISLQSKVRMEINAEENSLRGSEDYCLLFTAKKSAEEKILQLAKKFRINKIGKAKKGNGVFLNKKRLKPNGWQHF
ncbi:MAG: AIR synthase related protein [Fibromonadales bacterium]|nr:AIR synthase related protein [Fibromonadales bacterium]